MTDNDIRDRLLELDRAIETSPDTLRLKIERASYLSEIERRSMNTTQQQPPVATVVSPTPSKQHLTRRTWGLAQVLTLCIAIFTMLYVPTAADVMKQIAACAIASTAVLVLFVLASCEEGKNR